MSIVDRLNRSIVDRLRAARPGVRIEGQQFVRADAGGERRFAINEAKGVWLNRRDIYGRDVICVTFDFGDGQSIVVTEEDTMWRDMIGILDRSGSMLPSSAWLVQAIAQRSDDPPIDLRAGAS